MPFRSARLLASTAFLALTSLTCIPAHAELPRLPHTRDLASLGGALSGNLHTLFSPSRSGIVLKAGAGRTCMKRWGGGSTSRGSLSPGSRARGGRVGHSYSRIGIQGRLGYSNHHHGYAFKMKRR